MNELTTTLRELVEIPSITDSPAERDIILFTEDKLRSIIEQTKNSTWVEISIKRIEKAEENWKYHWWIICEIKVDKEKETVWLLWHLDVVPVGTGWKKSRLVLQKMKTIFTEDEPVIWNLEMQLWLKY